MVKHMSIIAATSDKACYEQQGFSDWERPLAKASKDLFIENLRDLLAQEGKSAAALARHLGVDRSLITAWLKGRSDPGIERLSAVAGYFNVPVSRFLLDPSDALSTGMDLETALRMVTDAVRQKT